MAEKRLEPEDYLRKHNIRQKLVDLTRDLIETQPPNPLEHLESTRAPNPEPEPEPEHKSSSPQMAKLLQARKNWKEGRAEFYAWLQLTPEEPLEPELEIVDPHHHLWDMRALPSSVNPFGIFKQKHYGLDDLLDDFIGGGHNITHTVYVEASQFHNIDVQDPMMAPLGEIQYVQGVAAQCASGKYGEIRCCAGIIGSADLEKFGAGVEPLLVACKAASPNFRGIRGVASFDKNLAVNFRNEPGIFAKETFRGGFALLAKHDLVFDAWLLACQLGDLYDLAKCFPDTTIVMNHIASPVGALGDNVSAPAYQGKQAEIVERWQVDMTRIARECPNVYVKIGGGGLPEMGHGFESQARPPSSTEVANLFRDTYLWTIKTFGCERCMLEGNFPVDKVSMSYTVLWNAHKRITADAGFSVVERGLLFSGTAKRVYRLP